MAFIEEPSNVSPQPVVALSYLRHLTSDVECRRTLLKSCRADLIVVRDKLSSVLVRKWNFSGRTTLVYIVLDIHD